MLYNKTELVELGFTHVPSTKFTVDKVTSKYDIEIVRIPVSIV
jgi:hypothetical protein